MGHSPHRNATLHDYLSPLEAGVLLHLNHQTVKKKVARGELQAIRVGNQGEYRILLTSIEAYLLLYPLEIIEEGKQRCLACKEIKNVEYFGAKRANKSGLLITCRECVAKRGLARRANKPEFLRRARVKHLYGISPIDYQEMFDAQNGVCAICKQPESRRKNKHLCIDHCHTTNAVRGLLCSRCNSVLGQIYENLETAQALVSYIEEKVHW